MTDQAEPSLEQDDSGGAPHAQSVTLEDQPAGHETPTDDLTEPKDTSLAQEHHIRELEHSDAEEQPDVDSGAPERELEVESHAEKAIHEESIGQQPSGVATDLATNVDGIPTDVPSFQTRDPLEEIGEPKDVHEEINQESLLKELKEALAEQEKARLSNSQLQHRIAEYLSKKKTEEQGEPGRSSADLEKRYMQCLASIDVIHSELQSAERSFQSNEAQMIQQRDDMLVQVQKAV